MRALLKAFYGILGIGSLANGLWMLASPAGWYVGVPAAVPDTGPLNTHFVHDIGVVFVVVGLGALWCLRNLERCVPVHWGITLFYAGHALVHVAEIAVGLLPHSHWWIDVPLVFLPALLLIVTGLPPVRHAVLRG